MRLIETLRHLRPPVYSELIAKVDATLADNMRVRIEAAESRVWLRTLLIKYRSHRFFYVSGGSDANDGDRVRVLLRDFCAADGPPKSFVGYSKGSVCQACGVTIKAGDLEYDLVTSTGELRLDATCYAIFIDMQPTTTGATAP
jgi:hypothetical protein